MNAFNEWVESIPGRQKMLADFFECSESAITQWKTNGVPRHRWRDVSRISGIKIRDLMPSELRDLIKLA